MNPEYLSKPDRMNFRLKCRKNKQVVNCWRVIFRSWKTLNRVNLTDFLGINILMGASVPCHHHCLPYTPPPPHPPAKSDVWPTMPSRKQMSYQKPDPGGDHYYVGCLGQTRVLLPEQLISDHRHIMVRGYQPNTSKRKPPLPWENALSWHMKWTKQNEVRMSLS